MKRNGDEENTSNLEADQEIDHNLEGHGSRLEQAADSGYGSSPDRKHHLTSISKEVTPPTATTEKISEKSSRDLSSNHKNQEDQLESARVEMGEVREENERLKSLLSEIVKDYQSLQKHVRDVLRQGKPAIPAPPVGAGRGSDREPDELAVSLTLGRTLSGATKTEDERKINLNEVETEDEMSKDELKLGLGFRYSERSPGELARDHSYRESFDELKEDEIAEIWPPSKILRTVKSTHDEYSQPTQVKKARVSVRVRCDTPTMNDGCQWRKYGQKIAKGNPCPRAYYRCTVSPSCPVRKQVQRCAEDMSVLITTYEGNHNHPLPVSATAMASTTAAAASILRSRSSSSSQQDPEAPTAASNSSIPTTSASLHGLSFSSIRDSEPNRLHFPSSSISTCNSHPTITLDLATPINPSSYNRFSSSSSPCLNFSAPPNLFGSSQLLAPWDSSSFLNYGANPINRSIQFRDGSLNLGRQATQEHPLKPYLQMSGLTSSSSSQQSLMTDTIAAATKAIATNPSFHSALAAALSSCNGDGSGYRDKAESFDQLKYPKQGGSSSADSVQISGQNRAACASNFISNPMNMNFQRQGGL